MTAARFDQNCGHWPDWENIPVEFDMPIALKDEVHFRHPSVIVNSRLLRNVHHMQACHSAAGECTARSPARAIDRFNFIELADREMRLRRLAEEIGRTTRRVNALENILIPRLQTQLDYIQMILEEREREDLFRLKRVKMKLGQRAL